MPVIQATCGRYNWTLRQDGTLYLTQPEIRSTFFFRRMLPSLS